VEWLIRQQEIRKDFHWLWLVLPILGAIFLGIVCILFFLSLFMGREEDTSISTESEVSSAFPQEARKYLSLYQEAGRKYGVPWEILAAIHKVETDFGRDLSVSSVGASGHTQFMDKTWVGWSYPGGTRLGDLPDSVDITNPKLITKYGGMGVDANGDGKANPYDPVDAIHATAKYLAANHSKGEDWFAPNGPVYDYNHDYQNYVLKVKRYAEQFVVATTANTSIPGDGFLFPVVGGKITSPYGMRVNPVTGVHRMHEGVDIGKGRGVPIMAADDGVVVENRAASGYGWMIVIQHANGLRTLYAHMYKEDVKVRVGNQVSRGHVIALMGSNGRSTGPHLHFEIHRNGAPIDPMPFIKR
jgi:murein DD-endopeptidase MepM/ murein hydrolase activator NlpD